MHINQKVLSLPPYISTSWSNINAIYMAEHQLMITLNNGENICIPDLDPETVESIFVAHASYIEQQNSEEQATQDKLAGLFPPSLLGTGEGDFSFRLGMGGMDGFGNVLQHNQEQAHAPDLPKEMLKKIATIAKIVSPEDLNAMPKAEPHCNCMHCQITRAIREEVENGEIEEETLLEEEVQDEELHFCQWQIEPAGEKLFTVINKLAPEEKYSVYLGHPVGCTCGKEGCEHILAVLRE